MDGMNMNNNSSNSVNLDKNQSVAQDQQYSANTATGMNQQYSTNTGMNQQYSANTVNTGMSQQYSANTATGMNQQYSTNTANAGMNQQYSANAATGMNQQYMTNQNMYGYVYPQQMAGSGYEEPMSVKEWLGSLLLLLIPMANLVLPFVWAFSSTEKKSKSNFFKAYLILALIGIGITVVFYAIIFGILLAMGETL